MSRLDEIEARVTTVDVDRAADLVATMIGVVGEASIAHGRGEITTAQAAEQCMGPAQSVADAMTHLRFGVADIPDLVAALRRVRERHAGSTDAAESGPSWCASCERLMDSVRWPCPTYLAALLPGEEA